jgi:arsenate reductase-like glutaredoxin family protein
MAVKASAIITLSHLVDIVSTTRYYKLQSSTAAAPSKPTANPPSGWSKTEPTYTAGSTNTLYFVDCTVFSNATFAYSDVSKSSSYEAAKEAYNKAQAAEKATETVKQELTDYKVDARKDMDSITASVTETRTELTTTTENVYDALGRLQDTAVSTEELESVKQLLITQWSDQLEYRFTQVTNLIDSTNGTIAENQRLLEQYIRFEGARITLGRSNSAIQAVLSNDKLEFVENGQTVAYISNRMLYITDAHITGSLSFGNADTGLYMWRYNAEADTFDLEFEGDD